jgi:YaiO family outer membrane protein
MIRGTTVRSLNAGTALLILVVLFLAVATEQASAQTSKYYTYGERQEIRRDLRFRIEGMISYGYLKPRDDFGSWGLGYGGLFADITDTWEVFGTIDSVSRTGGDLEEASAGILGSVGTSFSLTDNFSSTTTFSFGSNSVFLPRFRFDQEFGIAIPSNSSGDDAVTPVITPGVFYAQYFTDSELLGLFIGPTFYFGPAHVGYRLVHTESWPGAYEAYSHVVLGGVAKEGRFETDVAITVGEVVYLNTLATEPEEIDERAFDMMISHRHWIGVNWGLIAEAGYTDLSANYILWKFGAGLFYEF